jgi:hypothetical protein
MDFILSGVPTFVSVFYILFIIDLGFSFAVIECGVRAVSHKGYQQALRFIIRVRRFIYRSPACNFCRTGFRCCLHCYHRFQRSHLPYHLVQRCHRCAFDLSLLGVRVRQHCHWRRRKARWTRIKRVKRQAAFLTPLQNSTKLWNERRHTDAEFLGAKATSFRPHRDHGMVPEEVLSEFCAKRGHTFLASIRMVNTFDRISLVEEAQRAVHCASLCQLNPTLNGMGTSVRKTPKTCPLVWDTGTSFGLTPF